MTRAWGGAYGIQRTARKNATNTGNSDQLLLDSLQGRKQADALTAFTAGISAGDNFYGENKTRPRKQVAAINPKMHSRNLFLNQKFPSF